MAESISNGTWTNLVARRQNILLSMYYFGKGVGLQYFFSLLFQILARFSLIIFYYNIFANFTY